MNADLDIDGRAKGIAKGTTQDVPQRLATIAA